MSLPLRILLVVSAVCAFAYMVRKIRKSEVKIGDATFWFLFGLSLVVLAVFPEIAFFFSGLLDIESPSNSVFLYVIALLLIREFSMTAEVSRLRSKLAFLTQEVALKAASDRMSDPDIDFESDAVAAALERDADGLGASGSIGRTGDERLAEGVRG